MKNIISRLLMKPQLFVVLIAVGFCSVAQAAIVVNMKVSPGEDTLLVTTHGTCQGSQNSNGCIKVTGKQQINFNLTGNKKCSAARGARWELDSVVLSTAKNTRTGISAVAARDFGANQASGFIVEPVSQNANHIGVRDNNTGTYDIWYTVNAICMGGNGSVINIDPRIKNDGSGSN